jgi:peptide deformylase
MLRASHALKKQGAMAVHGVALSAFTGVSSLSLSRVAEASVTTQRPGQVCCVPGNSFLAGTTILFRRRRTPVRARLTMDKDQIVKVRGTVEEEKDPGAVLGTDLRVLQYPHPLLRAANAEIGDNEEELAEAKRIAKEMLLVMYAANGVGLAAPQVGINKRLMVFNPDGDKKAWLQEVILINPVIVGKSKASDEDIEGCLSFPRMSGKVRRNEWVKVEALRPNGKRIKIKYENYQARIFQHEFDHLDGVLYVDRLALEEREKVSDRLSELIAAYNALPHNGMEPAL